VLPKSDTIAAIATAPGRGGIGVVRMSGHNLASAALAIIGKPPQSRKATYASFLDSEGQVIDLGLALFFQSLEWYIN